MAEAVTAVGTAVLVFIAFGQLVMFYWQSSQSVVAGAGFVPVPVAVLLVREAAGLPPRVGVLLRGHVVAGPRLETYFRPQAARIRLG
jgi:hypothetical protein